MNKDGKSYLDKIQRIVDDFLGFVSMEISEKSEEFVEYINEKVIELLDYKKPKIMVYGIYNSGKSTLINALMKEKVADVADRPMTDKISEYDHGDYILVDSPGIDAPVEHEQVTEKFLDQCHIILFVISSKGGFEGMYNYEKMADLISKGIPFVIVLNERGCQIKKEWNVKEKELKRAEYAQELRNIQYKIIDNLKRITKNPDITKNYEVYVLNAQKAIIGIEKKRKELYQTSNVDALDKRIMQIIHNGNGLKVLKQPITNLRFCIDAAEKYIAEEMQENNTDYAIKINTLKKKKENLKEEMSILIKQCTSSNIEEIAQLYASGKAESAEEIEFTIFQRVEDAYEAKLNEIVTYVRNGFGELGKEISLMLDSRSNLLFEPKEKDYTKKNFKVDIDEEVEIEDIQSNIKTINKLFDLFVSQKKREKEKRMILEREAKILNMRNQNKLNETLRVRQEARQTASGDMYELKNVLIKVVNDGIREKFDSIIEYIEDIDCQNKELLEKGKHKRKELKEIEKQLDDLVNTII